MPPQTAKSLMKDFRASFRRKKVVVDQNAKAASVAKGIEDEELAKLTELKENLEDQLPAFYDDTDLLSFLRARSMKVKEAEKLLKLDENTKRFLQLNGYRPPEELRKYNFTSIIGVDKEGSLVRLINIGGLDIKGIISSVSSITSLTILMYMVNYDIMQQERENRKSGKKCKKYVLLINLEDLSISQLSYKPAIDMVIQVLKLLQDHYHDVLKKIYFLNQPPFFASVYKLFKSVMQDSLQQCVEFINEAELLKRIDADVLPKYLGGNRVDSNGDPRCTEFVNFGRVIPTSEYASNFFDPEDPDVTCMTIAAGATLNLRFPIREPGSVFKYQLQTKDNDIAVGLYREPFPSGTETPHTRRKKEEDISKLEQLTPIIRSQCHLCPEAGSSVMWFTGNVVLHFDNSYSWVNSKEVFFKVSVLPPTDVEKNFLNSPQNAALGISQAAFLQQE